MDLKNSILGIGTEQSVQIWDLDTHQRVSDVNTKASQVLVLGNTYVVVAEGNTLSLWDWTTQQMSYNTVLDRDIRALRFYDKTIYITYCERGQGMGECVLHQQLAGSDGKQSQNAHRTAGS